MLIMYSFQKEKGYAALSFYEPNGMMFFTAAPSKKLNELLKVTL